MRGQLILNSQTLSHVLRRLIMKILLVGGGGREHTLAWKMAQSKNLTKLYCAPGNPGIAQHAELASIEADDVAAIRAFAVENKIDLVVVGPEDPLTLGLADELRKEKIAVFGPSRRAAELEGSKVFAKELMHKSGIPTARFRVCQELEAARDHVRQVDAPVVVKADGLAKGKGVIVCQTEEEALHAVERIMRDKEFGDAGDRVVIEDCLVGEEASILAITDGKAIAMLETSQDHKPIFDGDKGPNTGGMGAYSPAPVVTPRLMANIERDVIVPVVHAMNRGGRPFVGVVYAGLMIGEDGPNALEFNVRFGDPETQPILMRMKSDIVPILMAAAKRRLEDVTIEWRPQAAVCVVMASGGYPGSYEKGKVIEGLDDAAKMEDVVVFHAGTKKEGGKILTNGGRVLGVTALGGTIAEAQKRAYEAVAKITFEGAQYRKDIADKALK